MSTKRTMPGGFAEPGSPKICRWCSLEVPKPRRTFCSERCVHEWRLRTDPAYLRDRVLARDKGICAVCKVDTLEAWLQLKRARGERRAKRLQHWGLTRMNRKSLWDADHIVPVVEGGGECDLSNIRTLCLRCHREATQELRQRRAVSNVSSRQSQTPPKPSPPDRSPSPGTSPTEPSRPPVWTDR